MIRNFLIIAYRNFVRTKFFSLINLFGLALGIASCILIFSYVAHELSYETMHPKRDQLYRVLSVASSGERTDQLAVSANIVAPTALRELPEVLNAARVIVMSDFRPVSIKFEEKVFNEDNFAFADSSLLQLFNFKWLAGDPTTALSQPFDVVISESLAKKYFGDGYAIGQVLRVDNRWDLKVTGIFEDFASNTISDFKLISSFHSLRSNTNLGWFPMNYQTFIELRPDASGVNVAQKLTQYVQEQKIPEFEASGIDIKFEFQPLREIYLTEGMRGDRGIHASRTTVYSFLLIGVFLLLIACINYINLTTAKSEKRAREVGIRKVMGAGKRELIWQFYGETFLLTILATLIAVGIAELTLPYFNSIAGKHISLELLSVKSIAILFVGSVIISAISGSYPALFLSSFTPAKVLRGGNQSGKAGDLFRKSLVSLQFIIASVLIIGVVVVYEQLSYASDQKLGFSSEAIALIPVANAESAKNIQVLKQKLLQNSSITGVTLGSEKLGSVRAGFGCIGEGMDASNAIPCNGYLADQNFLSTMDIETIAGGNFTNRAGNDSTFQFAINEVMLESLGWTEEEAIGKEFSPWAGEVSGKIVAVVKDFHFNSLKSKIEPLAIWVDPAQYRYMYVKMNMSQYRSTIKFIDETWRGINPNSPFEISFLDDELDQLYESESRTGDVLILFTGLSIIIGCLGLFGLTNFVVEKRTKEIGIRKVLGASTSRLVGILSWDFLKLILLANLVSWPVGWFFMNRWLDDFAYHVEIGPAVFVITLMTGLVLTAATVIFHALKTASSNPVNSLKYE